MNSDEVGLGERYARLAFEAYSVSRNGKDVRGGNIPKWEDVSEGVKEAWIVAVMAVIKAWNDEFLTTGSEAEHV